MGFIEQKKKQFIRWYYGSWVNDPQAEVPMFGAVIPYRALQLHALVRWLKKHKTQLFIACVAVLVLAVLA